MKKNINIYGKKQIKEKINEINEGNKSKDFFFSDEIYLSRKSEINNFHNLIIDQTQIGAKQYIEDNIKNTNDSFIIEDIEGLYFDKFSQKLEDKGYCVRTIEFRKEKVNKTNYYDPFAYINDRDDVVFLADLIISSIENAPQLDIVEEDPFWLTSSIVLLESIVDFISKSDTNNFDSLINLLQKKDLDVIRNIKGMPYGIKCLYKETLNVILENCHYKALKFKERILMHVDKDDINDLGQITDRRTAIFLVKPIFKFPTVGFSNMFYAFIYSKIRNMGGNSNSWRFFINVNDYNYDLRFLQNLLVESFSCNISVDFILKNLNNFQNKQRYIHVLDIFNQVVLFGGKKIESNIKYIDEIIKSLYIDEIFSPYSKDIQKDCSRVLQTLKSNEFVLFIKSEKIAMKDSNI